MSQARRFLSRVLLSLIPWIAVGAAAVLASACSEKGRSLVVVKVERDTTLMAATLGSVEIKAMWSSGELAHTFDFKGAQAGQAAGGGPSFGLYLPKSASGTVTVSAKGFTAGATAPVAASKETKSVLVKPGERFDVTVTLTAVSGIPAGDGGADAGSGGPGGSGDGGNAGGAPGTGGAAGGSDSNTGGAGAGGARSGGNSGAAGSGGGGGSGGTASGGAGGRAGMGSGGSAVGGNGSGGGVAGTGGTTSASPTWRGATMVESDALLPDYTPAVAVDASGNAVVAYRHGANIRASRYNATTSVWSAPFNIDGRTGGQAYSPSIAVDKNGRWLAVWQQDDALAFPGIWQSTSTDGMTWSAPAAITTAAGYDPELSMNKDGAAVVAWYDTSVGSDGFAVFASIRASATGTWTAALQMKPSIYVNSFPPHKVGTSGTGEAWVIWEDLDDAHLQSSVWMRRYSAGAWGAATLAETYDGGVASSSNIAVNSAGQAIIVWYQSSSAAVDVMARRYSPTGGLVSPASLGQAASAAWDPPFAVTLDEAGVATVAWAFAVQGKYNVYSNRAAHGAAWPTATAMETDNQAALMGSQFIDISKPAPALGCDAAGNVVLVWRKRMASGRFDLWGRRFAAGVWGTAALLETMDSDVDGPFWPALSVGSGGTAVTAWYYRNQNLIWTNVLR